MPHQASDAATLPRLPHNPVDCPILISVIIDPLLGSFNPELQLCTPDHYGDYVWFLATILCLLILFTVIRGVEKFNGRNQSTIGTIGREEIEMVELGGRR
jgi:hypothetical protein